MRPRWLGWIVWVGLAGATTLLLLTLRGRLDKAHVVLVYLLLVLGGSAAGGRRLGLLLAGAAFLLFNWFFVPPYGTFAVADPFDWLVLIAFLIVSAVTAQMLHRLQGEAEAARRRADEVDRLAALGAETLSVARAGDALAAIAAMIQSTLDVDDCEVHADGIGRLSEAALPFADADGDSVRAMRLPLRVRGRTVGVLELRSGRPIVLDEAQRRFLSAVSYYAALGVERTRLELEAGHAEILREADRMKDALLASVSHDLRTPLTTIKALAHQLWDQGDERALVIVEEADRMNHLVADLLDLSRLESGAMPVAVELTAVDDLVGAVVQRVSGALAERELRVSLAEGGTLLVGWFDLVHALHILINLVENAHKYSPPGSPIELAVDVRENRLIFVVADRGPGVAPGEQERIFEPFYRPPGTPPDVGGSGLGLAIARRLAEAQSGTLAYEPREGGGSRFLLSLPAAELPTAGELP